MRTLSEREREVLALRASGETYRAIGARYGLGQGRIRQIEGRAKERLAENRPLYLLLPHTTAWRLHLYEITTIERLSDLSDDDLLALGGITRRHVDQIHAALGANGANWVGEGEWRPRAREEAG
jgi:hypothetical protein